MTKLPIYAPPEFTQRFTQRSSDGVDVTLVWLQRDGAAEAVVCGCDWREAAYRQVALEPYLALHVDYHPFAYRAFTAVDNDHSGLAV